MGFPKPAHAFSFLCSCEQLVSVFNSVLPSGYDLLVDNNRCQVRFPPGHDCQDEEYRCACARKQLVYFHDTVLLCVLHGAAGLGKWCSHKSLCFKWKSSKTDNFSVSNGPEKGHHSLKSGWCC